MDHAKALVIKFVAISIVLLSILSIYDTSTLGGILLISLFVTGVAYFLGDLFILPRYGNLIAIIADVGLTFISVWLLGMLLFRPLDPLTTGALFSALFIAACEGLFHIYMKRHVLSKEIGNKSTKDVQFNQRQLQTEFAEETDIHDNKVVQINDKRK